MNRILANLTGAGLLLAVFVIVERRFSPTTVSMVRVDPRPVPTFHSANHKHAVRLDSPDTPGKFAVRSPVPSAQDSHGVSQSDSGTDMATKPPSSPAKEPFDGKGRFANQLLSRNDAREHSPSKHATASPDASDSDALPHGPSDPASESLPTLSPALAIDLDHPAVSHAEARERLDALADDFNDSIAQSGFDPASPEYRQAWDRETSTADARFRSMYGGRAWLSHHIHLHHSLQLPSGP